MVHVLVFLFGLAIGSFLNVVIYRTYRGIGFIRGRSYCPNCRHSLASRDLWPLFSYIALRGKCRWCAKRISIQYPLVELGTALTLLFLFIHFGETVEFFVYALYAIFLVIIFVQDLRYQLILDRISLPALVVVLPLSYFVLDIPIIDILIGIAVGGGFFALQFYLSRGKWIGGGDIRLGAVMGVMLGWQILLVALFLTYMVGSIASIVLILSKKKKWGSHIPLGTFLSAATYASFFFGEHLLWWFQYRFL
ncbi:prepilin peptidase [Patescibacteria group bacterium]